MAVHGGGVIRLPLAQKLKGILDLFGSWPPVKESFTKGQWGFYIWDLGKPGIGRGFANEPKLTAYIQSVINLNTFYLHKLKVDDQFGPKTEQAVKWLQALYGLPTTGVVDYRTWDLVDWIAFDSYFKHKNRRNKYKHWLVNDHGLSKETAFIECVVRANFPQAKFPRNWMVDRNIRGGTSKSEHAFGNANDFMTRKDFALGEEIFAWLITYQDRLGAKQIIYNKKIKESGALRFLKPTSLQHYDHIHTTNKSGTRWPVKG